ncbi:MAG: HlyD family efflux transporter periplasmic adaptor subunit [Planctomycetes bacterium]|nr:HlyD family efflux transporter periplasmic adaptor subunit [Planctomycetota bacterium]
MRRLAAIIVLAVVALSFAALAAVACWRESDTGSPASSPASPASPDAAALPVPPGADAASRGSSGRTAAKALGRVEAASEEIGVSSDLTGRIAEILVEEGDRVEKGAPLARLEPFVYQSRVEAAKAAVAQAVARRKLVEAGARRDEVDAARALLEETKASERLARSSWERTRQLVEAGISSAQAADQAREEMEAATSKVRSAEEKLELVLNWARAEELEAAEAEVAQRRHELAVAEAELDKTVLRAPIAGTIVRKNLRVGEAVSALQVQPVVTIADMSDLRVRAEVDEIDIARVRAGQRAELEVLSGSGKVFHGAVIRLGKTMGRKKVASDDPNERQDVRVLEVLIDIDEPDELPLGLRLTVSFVE